MNWRYKIGLNPLINEMSKKYDLTRFEDDCPTEVKTAIAAEVVKAPPLHRFGKSIAALNRLLDLIFDEADRSAVWCGM